MTSHLSPISSVSSYENYIATAGYDNRVILWSKTTRQFINRGCHDHLANFITFSPCGKFLLSTSSDYSARLWSVPDMRLKSVFAAHNDDVENASFSKSGNYIATASRDHMVRVFNIKGELIRTFEGHTADVLSVAWLNEDKELVSSSDDGTIRVWQVSDGATKHVLNFDDVETDTCDVFDRYVFAGNDNGCICIIDTLSGSLMATLPAHLAGIKSIKVSKEYGLLISSSYDKTVKIWQITEGEESLLRLVKTVACPSFLWLRAVNIVDGNTLAFGTFGSSFALFKIAEEEWDFSNVEHTGGKNAVLSTASGIYSVGDSGAIFRDDQVIAQANSLCNFLLQVESMVVTGGQTGELFNALTGEVIYRHHSPINCGTTYRIDDATYAVIGCYTGEGLIFKYADGALTYLQTVQLHANAIKGIASDGKTIFSVCANTDAAFHDVRTFELIKHIKKAHRLIANGADVLTGDQYVSISRDRKIRIWDKAFNYTEMDTPHTHSIKCVKVGAGTRALIATGSYNGLFCIYDTGLKEWIYSKRLTTSGISSISSVSGSNTFLASSYDGNIYPVTV